MHRLYSSPFLRRSL